MIAKEWLVSDEFIKSVCADLKDNKPIREALPQWGRIHIDRRLPFVCLYRRPNDLPDKDTKQLLLGQASYIFVREADAEHDSFKALLKAIMSNLSAAFGCALLFELWSEQANDTEDDNHSSPLFNIQAMAQRAPDVMLEELETELLAIPFKYSKSEVFLNYSKHSHPPLMAEIFNEQELKENEIYWVGLGINPIYRQAEKRLPYILKHLHRWLTLALRRSFYRFTRQYTSHRPVHFHELGRRSMTQAVWDTDRQLANIKDQFDILFHVTPVNGYEAWLAFENSRYTVTPRFNYRPRPIDPDLLKRQLYAIEIEKVEDPTLAYIFHSQRQEIDRKLTMISDRNNRNFLYGSLQIYGGVEPWLLTLAQQILSEFPQESLVEQTDLLSADEFIIRAKQLLAQYSKAMPEFQRCVEIRDDMADILVSNGKLLIGRTCRFNPATVDAILAHEVGTHMVTYFNGKAQPFQQFHSGMANYESLQEGLAVLAEYLVGQLASSRMRNLAARVIAVNSLIAGADFIDTFNLLHQTFHIAPYRAYFIAMRVYRGGGFTKDAIYLKGLSQLFTYLGEGGDLDILYLGKIAQDDIAFVEELKWRKILKERCLIPHYLNTEQSQHRLNKVRQGHSIINLVKEQQP
ncbi:flavohemoglobin expression-modulating QEGLA motif protein [Colwelliaceae bacterium 6471]